MIKTLRENKTLHEMLIGMFLFALLTGILCIVFAKRPLYCLVGLLAGLVGALFMVIHMAVTIENSVVLVEKDAVSYTRKMTVIRYGVACALMLAVGITDIGSPVLCVIGLLFLKAGAYLQPVVHKLTYGRKESEELDNELKGILGQEPENTDKN